MTKDPNKEDTEWYTAKGADTLLGWKKSALALRRRGKIKRTTNAHGRLIYLKADVDACVAEKKAIAAEREAREAKRAQILAKMRHGKTNIERALDGEEEFEAMVTEIKEKGKISLSIAKAEATRSKEDVKRQLAEMSEAKKEKKNDDDEQDKTRHTDIKVDAICADTVQEQHPYM